MYVLTKSRKRNRRFNRYKYKFIKKYLFKNKLDYIPIHEHKEFLKNTKKLNRWGLLSSTEMTVLTIIFNYYDAIENSYNPLVAFHMINEFRGNSVVINEESNLRSFIKETLYWERLRDGLELDDMILINDSYFEFCVSKAEEFIRSLV
jgi:hypothetical protein